MFEDELGTKFKDRQDAATRLAARLTKYRDTSPVVLGIPPGGVVLAFTIAQSLGAELGVFAARTVYDPGDRTFPIAGIAQNGVLVLDDHQIGTHKVTETKIKRAIAIEANKMEEDIQMYEGRRYNPHLKKRVVILVDEGIISSLAIRAAVAAVSLLKPSKIVLATPVCPKDFAEYLEDEIDDLVILHQPVMNETLEDWYSDLPRVSDAQVLALLHKSRELYPKMRDVR